MQGLFSKPDLKGRKAIVQFRAGKMNLENGLVTPDKRQGIFSLVQDPSGMLEVIWSSDERTESTAIFVGEAAFNRVGKCTTGNVFVLEIQNRTLFFWLQESGDRFDEYLKAVKKQIRDKTKEPRALHTGSAATKPQGNTIELNTLQNILSSLNRQPQSSRIQLQEVINSDTVLSSLRRDEASWMVDLHPHLPPGVDSDSSIVEQIRNPQVTEAATLLQHALEQPEGFRDITTAFGLQVDSAAGFGVNPFLDAILRQNGPKERDNNDKKE